MMSDTTTTTTAWVPTVWTGSGTASTTYSVHSGYCPHCITWYWGDHHCHAAYCGGHDHDFEQAKPPHQSTLFCRKCGETKQLKERRNGKPNV